MANAENRKRLMSNTEIVEFLSGFYGFSVQQFNNGIMLRLSLPKYLIEYYPSTGKVFNLRTKKWFVIHDIETFIDQQFL